MVGRIAIKIFRREHQAGIKDLEAAWDFEIRGALPEKRCRRIIGANLSLQFLTENPDFNGGILLSREITGLTAPF